MSYLGRAKTSHLKLAKLIIEVRFFGKIQNVFFNPKPHLAFFVLNRFIQDNSDHPDGDAA